MRGTDRVASGHRGQPARGTRHLRFRMARQGRPHRRAHPRTRIHVLHVERRAERQGRDARVPRGHGLHPHAVAAHRRAREAGWIDGAGQQQVGGSGPVSRRGGARRPDLRPDMAVEEGSVGHPVRALRQSSTVRAGDCMSDTAPRERWDEQLPLGRWFEAVASPQPLPAGGRVASLAGAFAAALVEKIGRIVLRSPKRSALHPAAEDVAARAAAAASADPRRGRSRRPCLRGRHRCATFGCCRLGSTARRRSVSGAIAADAHRILCRGDRTGAAAGGER